MTSFRRTTLAVMAVVAATACVSAGGSRPATGPAAGIAQARRDSARLPYTKADIEFMSGMIHHHAQAIVMAKMAPSHGASDAILRLTGRVINAQSDEITMMQGWLRDRNQPVPEPNPKGMTMTMGGMTHVMPMPGMLTDEQMAALDKARGPEFDRHFLTYMIQHHRGAIEMVHTLFAAPGAGQDETVFKFASDVNVDQATEIARMTQMVLELGGPVKSP